MRAPALPESCSRPTALFRGEFFAIDDWRCAGEDTPGRRQEWAPDDCVVVTRRGAWELESEGETRLADPLTATLWNRGAYRVRHPVSGGDACTIFRLTASGRRAVRDLSGGRARRSPRSTFATRFRPLDGRSYLLHRQALANARLPHGAPDPLAVEEPALAFLRLVSAGASRPSELPCAREASRYVERARDLIARDFRQPLTLGGIAREVHCSPFHLSRLFRHATGLTLHRTVVRLRLREGLERLLDQPGEVSTIALALGFASHSHFADAFRAEFGCSPSEARRTLAPRAARLLVQSSHDLPSSSRPGRSR
ncbi:MAG TPA: AraC family transcriptional regulator [Gemmatimonadales bacterium]|nr:AraC family transcriptional regulator [Gemmatimonadales bacterium]